MHWGRFNKRYRPGSDVPSLTNLTQVGQLADAIGAMQAVPPLVLDKLTGAWRISVSRDGVPTAFAGEVVRVYQNGDPVPAGTRPPLWPSEVTYDVRWAHTGLVESGLTPQGGRPSKEDRVRILPAEVGDPVLGLTGKDGRVRLSVLTEELHLRACQSPPQPQNRSLPRPPTDTLLQETSPMGKYHEGPEVNFDALDVHVGEPYDVRHMDYAILSIQTLDPGGAWNGATMSVQVSADGRVWDAHPDGAVSKGVDGIQVVSCDKFGYVRVRTNGQASSTTRMRYRWASKSNCE